MGDDVSIDELREAVEHMHGVRECFVEAVEAEERFQGDVVSQGAVKVFDLTEHPSGAKRTYGQLRASFRTGVARPCGAPGHRGCVISKPTSTRARRRGCRLANVT
jgi:hypothetical protein